MNAIDKATLVRAAALYVPGALALLLWGLRAPGRRVSAGILLACCWNAWSLFLLHLAALHFEWWSFHVSGGVFWGFPVDLYLGWILLWGALPLLVFPRARAGFVVPVFLIADLLFMPLCAPVVRLGPQWLVGEFFGLLFCLLPSLLLATWTRDDHFLPARAFGQILTFGGIFGFLTVAIAVAPTEIPAFSASLRDPTVLFRAQVLLFPGIMFIAAVLEFARRGQGTPIPFDPPRRLVMSGPYAFIANPMQSAMVLYLGLMAFFLGNARLAGAALVGVFYCAGIAAWDENADLRRRFGGEWAIYRKQVRPWLFRFRPWHPHLAGLRPPAILYVAQACGTCSQIGSWFMRRRPVALHVVPAEAHPTRDLARITYDPADGSQELSGVHAVAAALEHIDVGWALLGWFLRIPPIDHVGQTLLDAIGWGPMPVRRRMCSVENDGTLIVDGWRVQAYFRGDCL